MSKAKYKTNFQDIWLEDEEYKPWLQKVENNSHMARCKVCAKDINIAAHGITALNTHAKGSKHKERLPIVDSRSFFKAQNSAEGSTSAKPLESSSKQSTIDSCSSKTHVINAEVMWALDVVLSKYSFNSSTNKNKLFVAMFPDSDIAKSFACGKTKCSYLVNYGIAPYFFELLNNQLMEVEHFVALFDESHNKVEKQGQMDLHIRFWDDSQDMVATRYYSSEFLGKASANDICLKFEQCLGPLKSEKMIQVSSDGPNVNLRFLHILGDKRRDENLPNLIDLGTCGLHTVHNSLKHGDAASGWKMKKLMSSLHKIFHESPSRRADYKNVTSSSDKEFPMQFVGHRWVENEPVAKKAREIWPKIVEIVKYWKSLPKSKQPGQGKVGNNTSYDHLVKSIDDPLIPIKIMFFEEVARKLNEFLTLFQTDQPLAPFLVETLEGLVRFFMEKFILKSVMDKAHSAVSLTKIDVNDPTQQKPKPLVDLGFAVNHEIKFLKSNKKVTDSQLIKFKKEAVDFLAKICTHLIEKSPLSSYFARCLRCLSPVFIAECPEASEIAFEKILSKLVSLKTIASAVADKAKSEYHKFVIRTVKERKSEFLNFDKNVQRLDVFLMSCISCAEGFTEMGKVFKILLILSHGQAQVERGFSTNSKLLVENQNTESLIAQRVIHDHMKFHNHQPHTIKITAKLQNHVRQARGRYFSSQKERSQSSVKSVREERIKVLNDDIGSINKSIFQAQESIQSMRVAADGYLFEAENKENVIELRNLISKSTGLKRGAAEKQSALDGLLEKKKMLLKKKEEL